jgi:hypothetical protein
MRSPPLEESAPAMDKLDFFFMPRNRTLRRFFAGGLVAFPCPFLAKRHKRCIAHS